MLVLIIVNCQNLGHFDGAAKEVTNQFLLVPIDFPFANTGPPVVFADDKVEALKQGNSLANAFLVRFHGHMEMAKKLQSARRLFFSGFLSNSLVWEGS